MKSNKAYLVIMLLCGAVFISGCGATADNENPELAAVYYSDINGWNSSKGLAYNFLGRGINMGNYFDSPSYEGEWNGDLKIQASDFRNISEAGFASVRIPVRWSAHTLGSDPYTINEVFIERVQEVVDEAIAEGLRVIINTHHFNELFYNDAEFNLHHQRLLSFWQQLSRSFPLENYSADKLVFEFLNEPHENVGVNQWNYLIEELTRIVWVDNAATQNNSLGQRKVMIGTADWGGPFKLPELVLPESANAENTIITVHFYEPFQFTHQGAEWVDGATSWIGTRWLGTAQQQKVLFDYLDAVSDWNEQAGRGFEVNLGEFGVYSKYAVAADQKAWTAFIAREAERRGFSWHYWEYSSGFGAYNPATKKWRSALIEGLIPVSTAQLNE